MGFFDFLKPDRNQPNSAVSQVASMTQPQAERIYKDFGKFLVERQPVIHDASLLPHPKVKIMVAMKICERYMCDIANLYVRAGKDLALKEIVKHLDALRTCRGGLCTYSDIDAEDRNAVSHFNSFPSISDVPSEEKAECLYLFDKYMSRGMESEMPGWNAGLDSLMAKMKQKKE